VSRSPSPLDTRDSLHDDTRSITALLGDRVFFCYHSALHFDKLSAALGERPGPAPRVISSAARNRIEGSCFTEPPASIRPAGYSANDRDILPEGFPHERGNLLPARGMLCLQEGVRDTLLHLPRAPGRRGSKLDEGTSCGHRERRCVRARRKRKLRVPRGKARHQGMTSERSMCGMVFMALFVNEFRMFQTIKSV
jgi:hypothetical protein